MKKLLLLSILLTTSLSYGKTINIKMLNSGKEGAMIFEPSFVKASIGDTVTFIPTDPAHGSSSVFAPKGANTWKGQIDKKVSTKITKEGVYIYECQPHSIMGMVGVIQVGSPKNLNDAKTFAKDYSKKFAMNKDRLNNYLNKVK